IALWLSLRQSVHLARKLRPIYLKSAKKAYLKKKRQSYRRNREVLRTLIEETRVQLLEFRKKRDEALKKNDLVFKKRLLQQKGEQEKELRTVEDAFTLDQF